MTAVAPDTIKLDDVDAPPSLNLFMYRTSRNQGWAEVGLPTYDTNGSRVSNPPLALNLHYLLTAYGKSDFQAEILLGYAMHLLHERPVLDRAAMRLALDPSPLGPTILPPAFAALSASDLADQVDAVTITPEPMDTEELSRLWSAMQAHYRPSAPYHVSVVLIEARKPARNPLPVCRAGRSTRRPGATEASSSSRACCRRSRRSCASSRRTRSLLRAWARPSASRPPPRRDVRRRALRAPPPRHRARDRDRSRHRLDRRRRATAVRRPRRAAVACGRVHRQRLAGPAGRGRPARVERRRDPARTGAATAADDDYARRDDPARHRDARRAPAGPPGAGGPAHGRWRHRARRGPSGRNPRRSPSSSPRSRRETQWVRLTVDGVESLLVDRSAEPPTFDASQSVAVPA